YNFSASLTELSGNLSSDTSFRTSTGYDCNTTFKVHFSPNSYFWLSISNIMLKRKAAALKNSTLRFRFIYTKILAQLTQYLHHSACNAYINNKVYLSENIHHRNRDV